MRAVLARSALQALRVRSVVPRQRPRMSVSAAAEGGNGASGPAAAAGTAPPKVRSYPDEPRVGVGVVILRQLQPEKESAEVLLIRRAKEPSKGLWCFCGGSLELGETMTECAVREALEETGVAVRNRPNPGGLVYSPTLEWPVGVAAADALIRDAEGRLAYHYALVDYACVPEDPLQEPVPSDDVDAAAWLPVTSLRSMHGLVPKVAEITEEAVRRHDLAAATKRP